MRTFKFIALLLFLDICCDIAKIAGYTVGTVKRWKGELW